VLSPELQSKISVWRQKALDGTLTIDEMREAIVLMRQGRMSAASASEQARRTKAKAAVKSADELLSELTNL
jgi:hypothetical protein